MSVCSKARNEQRKTSGVCWEVPAGKSLPVFAVGRLGVTEAVFQSRHQQAGGLIWFLIFHYSLPEQVPSGVEVFE